jgi:excisionase family DNA binding protein
LRNIIASFIFHLRNIYFERINSIMKLLGVNEAAEKLGVSTRRVRALITEGKLAASYVGGGYIIEEAALNSVTVYGKAGRPPKSEGAKVNASTKATTKKPRNK